MITSTLRRREGERGAISIFTVMMFAILMSIMAVGFVRLMLDESEQTLQDDLSKSAYNAAQAGIEDAKRAMLKCQSMPLTTPSEILSQNDCEKQLYNSSCPGFNAVPNPAGAINRFDQIGIPASTTSQTSVGDSATAQGYSCVIVTPDTDDIVGELTTDSANDSVMFALSTTDSLSPIPGLNTFDRLKLEWHASTVADLKTSSQLGSPKYNPRKDDSGQWGDAPAALRLTIIKITPGMVTNEQSGTTSMNSTFLYPISNATPLPVNFTTPAPRYFAQCTDPSPATGKNYACSINMTVAPSSGRYFIVLKPLYKSTRFRLTASNSLTGALKFKEVEPAIDSTGYTSGVYRRVQARVQLGSDITTLSSALEAGQGVCKDFTVGGDVSAYRDLCP